MCDACGGNRILSVYAKCSDRCVVHFKEHSNEGYVPNDLPIGGGDDIEFEVCLDCGKVQGEFPVPDPEFSESTDDEEDEESW